jgi:phosphoglycerol transferase MdoB-like AlkP superfamily enzyme
MRKKLISILVVYALFFILDIYIHYQFKLSIKNYIDIYVPLLQELILSTIVLCILSTIKQKYLKNISILIFIIAYGSIFIIEALSVEITGDVVNLVSLNNAGQALILLNFPLLMKIFIFSLIFIFIIYLIYKIKEISTKNILISMLVLVLSYMILQQYKNSNYISNQQNAIFSPVKQFIELLELNSKDKSTEINMLSSKDIQIAENYNIIIDLDKKNPFEKNTIYNYNIPFVKKQNIKPNVIIFFIESLSSRLIGAYNHKFNMLTPNINNFANKAMVVKGYYNHATPTAPGLYGQNCSLYPLLTFNDMDANPNILKSLKLKCMASYMSDNSYKTFYFSHTRGHYTHFDQNFKLWGYDSVVLWRDFVKKFLHTNELVLGEAGPSDHQMLKGVTEFLKNHKDKKKPFFVGVSTIESHVGRVTNPIDGIKYKDGDSETLNLIHNFDDAFKTFWNYFKKSKFFNNTIVILTGDHALYPNRDYKKVAGKDWIPSVYDDLSLIIYDPTHKLPKTYQVNATSLDLAPTVLELAGINKNAKNSFMGTSIFDKKKYNNSFGISAYSDFNFFINTNGKIKNIKPKNIKNKNIKQIYTSLHKVLEYSKYIREINTTTP